jgi:hypothetical protein
MPSYHIQSTSIRPLTLVVLLAVLASALPAQEPVKKNLMVLVDQVPPPPSSVRDAYAKTIGSKETGGRTINAGKVFDSIDREIKSVEAALKTQPPDVATAASGMSPDMMKKMQDPEMKKKMKKMSKEEKMKTAMEMMDSGAMSQPVVVMDPPPIRAALDEWQKITVSFPTEFKSAEAALKEDTRTQEEYEKGHAEIGHWEKAEIAKLPQISSGEMSAPDPAKMKVVQLKAADRHIAFANRRLWVILSTWRAYAEKTKRRYGVFYQKLLAADYALDSKNFSTKKTLADAQMKILADIGRLISQSRTAYEESSQWMAHRVAIERQ